jgi:hypothetical protein
VKEVFRGYHLIKQHTPAVKKAAEILGGAMLTTFAAVITGLMTLNITGGGAVRA